MPKAESQAGLRCAIYTRKSSEEGLDQSFNSLQAQREAGEAYVLSQRQSGWTLLQANYDDGGFSGASLERPGLTQLLADIEMGSIDCVVVYKVDRLSRSLLDFARLMSLFESKGISFVSVTQDFNTTTSMGRLTLNILLSFAQFEREIISERTRDKVGAARRKGKWSGGVPVLGYDVVPGGGRLVINAAEAAQVREIYAICDETGTLAGTLREVHRRGYQTKTWIARGGRKHVGRPFSTTTLLQLLRNVLYQGSISHNGVIYPGEQPAIIEPEVWERVNKRLRDKSAAQADKVRVRQESHLQGGLFCAVCGAPLRLSYTRRHGKRYDYYVCKGKPEGARCQQPPVAMGDLEGAVLAQVQAIRGSQLSWFGLQQSLERVTFQGDTRQVSVVFSDRTRFSFGLPAAHRPGQRRKSSTEQAPARIPRISRLMALALKLEGLVRDGTVTNYAELARLGPVSGTRLSQILNLLNLSPAIQESILFLPRTAVGSDRITEKRLRPVTQIVDWDTQQAHFDELGRDRF